MISTEEDEQIGWHDVASNFTDRNNKDCRKRWVYTLAPSIKKGAWDESEDALLLKGIEHHGYKYIFAYAESKRALLIFYRWALVSQIVGSRQPDRKSGMTVTHSLRADTHKNALDDGTNP